MKTHIKIKLALASTLLSFNVFASGELHLDHANTDISDKASLQNGAKLFMNYCSGCHAIGFMRYNRIAQDLNLSDSLVAEALNVCRGKAWRNNHNSYAKREAQQNGLVSLRQTCRWLRDPKALIGFIPT